VDLLAFLNAFINQHSRIASMKNLIGIVTLALANPVFGQTTFHGNNARDGVYASAGPTTLTGVKWQFKTGGPIVGSPVAFDKVIYTTSLDAHVYAIDQASGKEKWKFKSALPIASSPAIADGKLYFVSSTGALAALDLATGKPKWVFVADYERRFEAKNLHGYSPKQQTIPDAWDVYTSSPAAAGDKVFFGAGDGGIYAVNANTGVLQWKYQTGNVVHGSPAVVGGVVYVGGYDSKLYALDAETGILKWVFQAGVDPAVHNQVGFQASPAVVDGVVYIGCRDAHVYAIDAATGKKIWDYPTSKSWVNTTPAVRNGLVYAATSDSSRMMAIDAKTGRLRFNFDAKAYMFSSPALAGNTAYFGSHNGKLYAINATNGALRWTFQTEASNANSLKLLNPDGSLNQDSFTQTFGDFQDMYIDFYRFTTIGAIFSSPTLVDGVIFVGSTDGNLYALH
jgi:eukaryotic-like serine/threonine-protein kinase